jgi:hypothetical protein
LRVPLDCLGNRLKKLAQTCFLVMGSRQRLFKAILGRSSFTLPISTISPRTTKFLQRSQDGQSRTNIFFLRDLIEFGSRSKSESWLCCNVNRSRIFKRELLLFR